MIKNIMLLCLLPLFLGGLVYIFFRQSGIFGLSLKPLHYKDSVLPPVLINILPDFCWAFSFSNTLNFFFWQFGLSFWKAAAFMLAPICFSEFIQLFFPQYFTFDIADLLVEIFAFFLSSIYFHRRVYENKAL
jgi:hypothetical protein